MASLRRDRFRSLFEAALAFRRCFILLHEPLEIDFDSIQIQFCIVYVRRLHCRNSRVGLTCYIRVIVDLKECLTFDRARCSAFPFVFAIELDKLGAHGVTILIWIGHVVPVFTTIVGCTDIFRSARQKRLGDRQARSQNQE
jgi:hypothetical protein